MSRKKVVEFSKNSWGGLEHFECAIDACRFDTFEALDMLRHLVNIHNSETALGQLLKIEEDVNGKDNSNKDGG